MRVDADADASYIALRDVPVARTDRYSDSVLIDVDAAGQLVGIELLTLTADVDVAGIAARYGLPDTVRDELRRTFSGESA